MKENMCEIEDQFFIGLLKHLNLVGEERLIVKSTSRMKDVITDKNRLL